MMQRASSLTLLGLAVAVQLLTTGCLGLSGGGGSSTSGLFDGGSGSGSSSSASTGSGDSSIALASLGSEGSGSGGSGSGGPVNNPEPTSVALFGGGLVGLGLWRRRKVSKRS